MDAGVDPLALLMLQLEWGADDALDAEPVSRLRPVADTTPNLFRRGEPATGSPGAGAMMVPVAAPAKPSGRRTPAERAEAAAALADNLGALRAAITAFDGCPLRDTASHAVLAEGSPSSGLLLIGEPPCADEDRAGRVFAGREGALLDRMLASIGISRGSLLLTPLIPWRPPGGRPPNPGELTVCLPFLHRLITLAAPHRLVISGGLAARTLLGAQAPRRRANPGWADCRIPGLAEPIPALILPGLAMLLKTPGLRRDAWAGLRLLRRTIDNETNQ